MEPVKVHIGISRKSREAISMDRYDQQAFSKCMQTFNYKIF